MLDRLPVRRAPRQGVEDWADVVGKLDENQVLWVDLVDPSDDDERAVRDWVRVRRGEAPAGAKTPRPELELAEDHIRVTAVAVSDDEKDPGPRSRS